METYSFSTELQKNTSLYIMEKLDSYFSFQGKRTRVIAITPAGLAIAYEQNIHLSMTVKILKVLSFLLLPLVLIAAALRYLLHKRFIGNNIHHPRNYFIYLQSLPPATLEKDPLLTTALVQRAITNAPSSFFSMPRKYQKWTLEYGKSSLPSKLELSIDLEKLIEDINLETIPLKNSLNDVLYRKERFYSPLEATLIKELIDKEKDAYISTQGKNQLLKFMLDHILFECETNKHQKYFPNPHTVLPGASLINRYIPSIWKAIFFSETSCLGVQILEKLKKLGVRIAFSADFNKENLDLRSHKTTICWGTLHPAIITEIKKYDESIK